MLDNRFNRAQRRETFPFTTMSSAIVVKDAASSELNDDIFKKCQGNKIKHWGENDAKTLKHTQIK